MWTDPCACSKEIGVMRPLRVNDFDLHRLTHATRTDVVLEVQSVVGALGQDEACGARVEQRAEIAVKDAQRKKVRHLLLKQPVHALPRFFLAQTTPGHTAQSQGKVKKLAQQ
jgi:hypothetical protein